MLYGNYSRKAPLRRSGESLFLGQSALSALAVLEGLWSFPGVSTTILESGDFLRLSTPEGPPRRLRARAGGDSGRSRPPRASDLSLRAVAICLAAQGHRSRTGRSFAPIQVARMLEAT
jgi:hypothetical protein